VSLVSDLRIAILTCSDSRSRGEGSDTAGAALKDLCEQQGWEVVECDICADDPEHIADALVRMADVQRADVILTTGGTGLGPRDVTPEATLEVADRAVPGIAEHIRAASMAVTQRAMLSRAVAAQRGTTLIVNLPGSEKAVRESFAFVAPQFEHSVKMMHGGGH
jgi:molybdenum cofactor synthesis domain-containing protein